MDVTENKKLQTSNYILTATVRVYINSEGTKGIYLAAHVSADNRCLCYRKRTPRQYLFRISPGRV